MAYILENKISIFSLALIFSSFCLASSTKDFSYSFLREDGKDKEAQNKAVDEPEAGKEAVELRKEGVDSRDLQAQLLDEANKVEEAVRRLGSFRGSDKQEGKEQHKDKYKEEEKVEVVVSKSEAVLLCSFFKDRARLPEYCESEEGALGKEKDGKEAFNKNDDRHQEGKRDTAVDVETLAVKRDSTKLINNPQLAEVVHVDNVVGPKRQRQQPMASQDPSNQWDSVSNMLRTFGFQRFLYPAQRHKNFMGSPHGFQQASSPAWYPAQPQTSPYEAFMSNLHLQRLPHQHLHIHMSQGMGSDLTNQEENVKSRKKRNSMLPWPFRGWQSSFSLGIPLPNYLFNPLNLGFNPHILPNLDFQLLSRASPQLPLWQPTAPGRGHKFSSSLAYQVFFANFSYLAYDVVSFLFNNLFGLFYSTPNAFLSQPSLASFYRPRFGSTIPKTATTGKVSCK